MVNDASRRSHDFKDELGGKPEWDGVYCERALKLHPSWKGLSGKAKVKTGIGKSDLPGLQGGPRKRDLVSYYMVRAPRLYPDSLPPFNSQSCSRGNDSGLFRAIKLCPVCRPTGQNAKSSYRTWIHRGFSRERIDQSALQVSCGELLSLVDRE